MEILLLALYIVLLVLNLLDGISTWIFVRPDHYDREANPVARWMFKRLGISLGIIVAEFLWMGTVSILYFTLFQRYQVLGLVLTAIGVAVWSWIVPGNVRYCLSLSARKKASQSKPESQI